MLSKSIFGTAVSAFALSEIAILLETPAPLDAVMPPDQTSPPTPPTFTGTPNPTTASTSGRASANSLPYRSAMQPVTTSRFPSLGKSDFSLCSAASRSPAPPSLTCSDKLKIASTDSSLADSTNAQVFTTTRSASSAPSARRIPSASSEPAILSEST